MLNQIKHIDLLFKEKDDMRKEILQVEGSLLNIFIASMTALVALIGVYFSKDFIAIPSLKPQLLFALSQLEYLFIIIGILQTALINVHAGYICAIENKINSLANASISKWESSISPLFISSPKGISFWATSALWTCFIVVYIIINTMVYYSTRNSYIYILSIVEMVIALILSLLAISEKRRTAEYANALL